MSDNATKRIVASAWRKTVKMIACAPRIDLFSFLVKNPNCTI